MTARQLKIFAILAMLVLPWTCQAASKAEIDAKVEAALDDFYAHSPAGSKLARQAKGMLVFPSVVKAGIGIGGEYGEGSLMVGNQPVAYYNIAAASVGFQLGAQVKSEILLFMTTEALEKFRNSQGWEAGVDGSVAVVNMGAGGEIDTETIQDPIIGFIFSNKGLMFNLSLEGSKITEISR